jgi:hypothetical protein
MHSHLVWAPQHQRCQQQQQQQQQEALLVAEEVLGI